MVSEGKVYFLSRPRRFGKSLLVSALDALFSGKKDLFEGLYIYDKWNWSEKYPVIRLDFGSRAYSSFEELKVSLNDFVESTAGSYDISLMEKTLPGKFGELIKKIHISTNRQAVILVDEYDKPVTDYLSNIDIMTANKNVLHDFYQVLKAADDHINFIFLTGVSRFSGVSVFSALNSPNDITLHRNYASICGYTQEELENYFDDYINEVAENMNVTKDELLDRIKEWYNGYSWDGKTSVYNPFSTLKLFNSGDFGNYWFRTGTPSFLINILKSRNQIKPVLEPVTVGSSLFDSYDPVNIGEISLLFQTGYLTVKSAEYESGSIRYTLGMPDREVEESFLEHLMNAYSNYPVEQMQPLICGIRKQICAGDVSGLEQNLRLLIANIPYRLHLKNEAYYHSLFLLLMKMIGFNIQGEIMTAAGRIDAVWVQHDGTTVIAEIKYSAKQKADVLLDRAIEQIHDRRYYEGYLDRKVILMAIAFAGKDVKCKMEIM
jgi:hypothetical protein